MGFYEEFKRVRNQLRRLDVISLVYTATAKIRDIEAKRPDQWSGWLPWRLLLLIKWGFEYGGVNYPLKITDERMLVKLVNMMHDVEGAATSPFLEEERIVGLQRFLRTIAFQQFWIQNRLGSWVIARQFILFCKMPNDHPIQVLFHQSMDISMRAFLELSWLLWAWLAKDSRNLVCQPNSLFKNLDYPQRTVRSFFTSISLSPSDVQKYLEGRKQIVKNTFLQLTEQTPFVRYPILKLNDGYLIYSQRVFKETISNIFYDIMKSEGGSGLAEMFASEFENYIAKGLSSINRNFYTERELSREFPEESITDFVLPLDDLTLILEVKATEMRPIVRVYPDKKPLIRELEDNVVKGVIQGFSVANAIMQDSDNLEIPCRSEFFLMIITYRDLFLGPGEAAWEEFLREAVEPTLLSKGTDLNTIPPEGIVILSIDEFDQFISIIWEESAPISIILHEMVDANSNWETRKLLFSQHLDKYRPEEPRHPFLDDEFEELADSINLRFIS